MDCSTVWEAALAELELQMTQATFDTLLRSTTALCREDALEVVVGSAYAQEWLESRLREVIEQTVARVAGAPVEVRFVVVEISQDRGEDLERGGEIKAPGFVVPEFDVHEAGFFKVAGYETRFWAPLLGRVAWRVMEIVRETDKRGRKRTEWTPRRRWTAPALAAEVPCGRQALVGVNRTCEQGTPGAYQVEDGWRVHRDGAFDRLVGMGVAIVERRGESPHVTYWMSVRNQLGLLQPVQLVRLPARLQVKHDQWLTDRGFDPREWDVGFA